MAKSVALTEIEGDPDPLSRLARLADYIADGEAKLTAARRLRVAAVREAREDGATWPVIAARSRAGEAYLRREMTWRRPAATPNPDLSPTS